MIKSPSSSSTAVPAPSDQPETVVALLSAALDIVAEAGITGLTLRPIAERAGLSVGAVTHHLGNRDSVVAHLAAFARQTDRGWRSRWETRLQAVSRPTPAIRASLCELALHDLASGERLRSILFCEMLLATDLPNDARAELAGWIGELETFWGAMSGSAELGTALLAYVVDELIYALSLDGNEAYRLLRSLCIQRFFGADRGARRDAALALFRLAQADLSPEHSVVDRRIEGVGDSKRAMIARAAGKLIVEAGPAGVTHRSVGDAANVPSSTVVYHFGAIEDLMLAGLEAVIGSFHQWLPAARARGQHMRDNGHDFSRTRGLVRATWAIAAGAIRHGRLIPHAADMRRRRGENIQPQDISTPSDGVLQNFDALDAQVVSTVSFGARIIAMALGEEEGGWSRRAMSGLLGSWAGRPGGRS